MASASPGWYDDGTGTTRWWDGTQWTADVQAWVPPDGAIHVGAAAPTGGPENTSPFPAGVVTHRSPSTPASAPIPRRTVRGWLPAILIGVTAGLVTAVVVIALILLGPLRDLLGPDAPTTATSSGEDGAPPAREHTEEELAAAAAGVEAFTQAWWRSDCDAYFATTTEGYREITETTDCETFYLSSRTYREGNVTFSLETVATTSVGNAIEVSVVEHYSSYFDEEGVQQEEPVDVDEAWDYFVVQIDGEWKVDNFFSSTD